jgi:nucleoid DNA-binding protein
MASLADVAHHAGIRLEYADRLFDSLLETLLHSEDHQVTIRSIGTWKLHIRKQRTYKSPALPGGVVVKPDEYTIKFTPSTSAKATLNSPARSKSAPRPQVPVEELTFQKRTRK